MNLDSTSSQPQPQITLNLNLNSIWLWNKSNPILFYNRLQKWQCFDVLGLKQCKKWKVIEASKQIKKALCRTWIATRKNVCLLYLWLYWFWFEDKELLLNTRFENQCQYLLENGGRRTLLYHMKERREKWCLTVQQHWGEEA